MTTIMPTYDHADELALLPRKEVALMEQLEFCAQTERKTAFRPSFSRTRSQLQIKVEQARVRLPRPRPTSTEPPQHNPHQAPQLFAEPLQDQPRSEDEEGGSSSSMSDKVAGTSGDEEAEERARYEAVMDRCKGQMTLMRAATRPPPPENNPGHRFDRRNARKYVPEGDAYEDMLTPNGPPEIDCSEELLE